MPRYEVGLNGTQFRQGFINGNLVLSDQDTMANHQHFLEIRPDPVRRRRPKGWLYPTAYELDTSVLRGGYGSFTYRQSSDTTYRFSGALHDTTIGYSAVNPLSIGNLKARAETKALLAVKGQRINLGVAFAEAQKTANLVGSTATRLAGAYRAARKGDFRQALSLLGVGRVRQLPSTWLEAQYGWMPLLKDVHGAAHELAVMLNSSPHLFRVTGIGALHEEVDDDVIFTGTSGLRTRAKGKRRVGVKVRLDYEPSSAFLQGAARMGLTNPLEVGWELVPYSFVVDWFIPVGDFLSALDATLGLQFKSGSCTTFQSVNHQLSAAPASGPYLGGSLSGARKRVVVRRTVYLSSPFPPLPGLAKSPLNLRRMSNGLALLANAFR